MGRCDTYLFWLCLTKPPVETGFAIFGFAEFLAALALLVLVFSSSDQLYHFRISIAPLPVRQISFYATVSIGVGTLATDLWFAERWYALPWGFSRSAIQGIWGALFLLTAILWLCFAFVAPPIFGRWNYRRFEDAVARAVFRGSDMHLAILAAELSRSSESLIKFANARQVGPNQRPLKVHMAANRVLDLIGNRKLCRHIVASAPGTATSLMHFASREQARGLPLGSMAQKITAEALLNRDSILYHEDELTWDVLSRQQSFSKAMYGDFPLVESISTTFQSPLDLDYQLSWDLDGDQFEAYCRIVLITFKSYVTTGRYQHHSYVLVRALKIITDAGHELYKLNNQSMDATSGTAARRLGAAARFINDVIEFLGTQENLNTGTLRVREIGARAFDRTIFDRIADVMFELVYAASSIRAPTDNVWWIHYNTLWSTMVVRTGDSPAWRTVRFKFFRLLFDEIKRLEDFPNYKGASILSVCWNVLGFAAADRKQYPTESRLQWAIIKWTKRHYLRLREVHSPVAEHCLTGGITFDAVDCRLVKTYAQGLNLEPSCTYLDLGEPKPLKRQERRKSRAEPQR